MAERGKYYWLKLKEDFFDDKVIKYLRKLPEGPTLVIIYLKMQLKSLKTEGFLRYDGILPTCEEELALVLDEPPMLVTGAINALVKMGVVERWENDVLYMKAMQDLVGSETTVAERVRKHRALKEAGGVPMLETSETAETTAKSNAERQRAFRAKKACEKAGCVTMIDDVTNHEKYGGNYFTVTKREKFKCGICGGTDDLNVYHIDGFDESNPNCNLENKLLLLCGKCRSKAQSGVPIPDSVLESIDYFDSNDALQCNSNVTKCNTEKREKRKEKREKIKDIEIDTEERDDKRPGSVERVNYELIQSLYNDICKSYPRCTKLSDARKRAIKARFNSGYTIDDFKLLFEKAEASSFLKGESDRGWRASFDWLITDSNMAKVLDGNYDGATGNSRNAPASFDLDEFDRYTLGTATGSGTDGA